MAPGTRDLALVWGLQPPLSSRHVASAHRAGGTPRALGGPRQREWHAPGARPLAADERRREASGRADGECGLRPTVMDGQPDAAQEGPGMRAAEAEPLAGVSAASRRAAGKPGGRLSCGRGGEGGAAGCNGFEAPGVLPRWPAPRGPRILGDCTVVCSCVDNEKPKISSSF